MEEFMPKILLWPIHCRSYRNCPKQQGQRLERNWKKLLKMVIVNCTLLKKNCRSLRLWNLTTTPYQELTTGIHSITWLLNQCVIRFSICFLKIAQPCYIGSLGHLYFIPKHF